MARMVAARVETRAAAARAAARAAGRLEARARAAACRFAGQERGGRAVLVPLLPQPMRRVGQCVIQLRGVDRQLRLQRRFGEPVPRRALPTSLLRIGSCALSASISSCLERRPSPLTSTTRHQACRSARRSGTASTDEIGRRVSGQCLQEGSEKGSDEKGPKGPRRFGGAVFPQPDRVQVRLSARKGESRRISANLGESGPVAAPQPLLRRAEVEEAVGDAPPAGEEDTHRTARQRLEADRALGVPQRLAVLPCGRHRRRARRRVERSSRSDGRPRCSKRARSRRRYGESHRDVLLRRRRRGRRLLLWHLNNERLARLHANWDHRGEHLPARGGEGHGLAGGHARRDTHSELHAHRSPRTQACALLLLLLLLCSCCRYLRSTRDRRAFIPRAMDSS